MYIERLAVKNFRNIESAMLDDLSPEINIFMGENAQGKTNLIEAVNYLSCGRSFRNAPEDALIREGENAAELSAIYCNEYSRGKIDAALFHNKRRSVKVNGLPVKKMSEMIGRINTVVFAPEDIRVLKDRPQLRRRMMDIEISKMHMRYYVMLQQYMLVLKNKNKLLKEKKGDDALLAVYNLQLAEYAAEIIEMRYRFFDQLSEYAEQIHGFLCGSREVMSVQYRGSVPRENIKEDLMKRLDALSEKEKYFGVSLIGPHREDWDILIDGKDARTKASQGQQRTAMISFKLACAELAKNEMNEMPVLLLDDIFSELDISRRKRLIEKIRNAQVFITATDAETVQDFKNIQKTEVRKGSFFR